MKKQKEQKTAIQVSADTWSWLNKKKEKPNESFDEVIQRLIKFYDEREWDA